MNTLTEMLRLSVIAGALAFSAESAHAQAETVNRRPFTDADQAALSDMKKCPPIQLRGWRDRQPVWAKDPPPMSECDAMYRRSKSDPFEPGTAMWCTRSQMITDCRIAAVEAYSESNKRYDDERKRAAVERAAEADRLAKELGVSRSDPSKKEIEETDAAALARQLGVSTEPAGSKEYTAAQLQQDIKSWEEQERLRKEDEERQRQLREEQERLAAIEREKRAEILREQQMALRQQKQQQQTMSEYQEPEEEPGLFGSILGAVAKGYLAKEMGMDPAQAILNDVPSSSSRSSTSDGAGFGACSNPQITKLYAECASIQATSGMCTYYRQTAECARRLEATSAACPDYAAQVRETRLKAEQGAAQLCSQ